MDNSRKQILLMSEVQYWQKIKGLFSSSIIAYFPMWEASGTTMTDIQNAYNGAYQGSTGVTLGNAPIRGARTSAFVDANNSWCRITNATALTAISTALANDWTIMFDYKPFAAANWADGLDHYLMRWQVDGNNLVQIYNPSADAHLYYQYVAGGTSEQRVRITMTTSDRIHVAMTGSASNDRVRAYMDGAQLGADLTVLGDFAGSLAYAAIGEYFPGNGDNAGAYGYFSNFLVLNKEATPAEVASVNSFSLGAVQAPAAGGFTVVFVPDTQAMVQTAAYRDGLTTMMNWIVANKTALNIQAVMTEGDVVETVGTAAEWTAADASYDVLDTDGTIPYLIAIGDHDYDNAGTHTATTFNATFPQARYTGQSWWAGGFYEAGHSENAYNVVTIGGVNYLFVILETSTPRAEVLTWLDELLTTHASKKAILTTHAYLTSANARDANGASIWNVIKTHDNVIWVGCGNYVDPDGYGRLTSQTDGGKNVHQVLFDTQSLEYGGPWLRVVKFHPGGNIVSETYSPCSRLKLTDSDNEFSLGWPS